MSAEHPDRAPAAAIETKRVSGMNVLLLTHGTAGDVHPFMAISLEMRRRGHDVTLMANPYFRRLVESHGIDFVPIGSEAEHIRTYERPDFWRPFEGTRTLGRHMAELLGPQYDAIEARHVPGETLLVASGAVFAARCAHDALRIPLATIILQPAVVPSAYETPIVAGFPSGLSRLPRFLKAPGIRAMEAFGDRLFRVKELNAFRSDRGLPPVRRVIRDWWLSPQLAVCLFPDWFAPRQPDWPDQIRHTGFPMADLKKEQQTLPADVATFLDGGDPPIVFTPGSAMMHGQAFVSALVEACRALGRRGMLLSPHGADWLGPPTDQFAHFDYVPFSLVLPRAAALVHHGGVGTLAQALRAGIPHLVMPMLVDQPDNAARLRRLGVGDWIKPSRFRGPAVARALDRLLHSPTVRQCCAETARRFDGVTPLEDTCDLIESLPDTHRATTLSPMTSSAI
jgi:UDP:flavonoid glycosyltransferase YjiC (YdhE family)